MEGFPGMKDDFLHFSTASDISSDEPSREKYSQKRLAFQKRELKTKLLYIVQLSYHGIEEEYQDHNELLKH